MPELNLTNVALVIGVIAIVGRLPLLVAPALARRGIAAFPRHVLTGRLLALIAMAWGTYELFQMPMGFLDAWKPVLWGLAPVSYVLIIFFLDELLPVRALGGLLLLAPTPMLDAARWHPSPWRFVIIALAFAWVIWGMVLVVTPFRLRQAAAFWIATDGRCRLAGLLGVLVGAFLIALALTVYRGG